MDNSNIIDPDKFFGRTPDRTEGDTPQMTETDRFFGRTPDQRTPRPRRLTDMGEYSTDTFTPITNNRQDKLSKRDLLTNENMNTIRTYMNERYGYGTTDRYDTDEKLMERFVDSMRFFHGNALGTAGEATWVMNADEGQKQSAAAAYDLFDRLGNVFVVDGAMGALDGIKDYIFAAARDPSSYLGLFTGGAAKAAVLTSQTAGKQAILKAAQEAGEKALRAGLSREAREDFVVAEMEKVVRSISADGVNANARRRLFGQVERNVRDQADTLYRMYPTGGRTKTGRIERRKKASPSGKIAESARLQFEEGLRQQGQQEFYEGIVKRGERAALAGAFGGDAFAALASDVALQNTMIDVGAQEKFSAAQTAIGTFVGGALAPGMKIASDTLQRMSGRTVRTSDVAINKFRREREVLAATALDAAEVDLASETIKEVTSKYVNKFNDMKMSPDTWAEKVARGEEAGSREMDIYTQFLKELMFGTSDEKVGGLMKLYEDRDMKLPEGVRVADFLTSIIDDLPPEDITFIDNELKRMGLNLGAFTEGGDALGTLGGILAAQASEAGTILGLYGQFKRAIDTTLLRAHNSITEQAEELVGSGKVKEPEVLRYAQSVWRRMLVSNPATSMVNIAGAAMYQGAQNISEALNMVGYRTVGLIKNGLGMDGSRELRNSRIYWEVLGQKMANVLDPHTTRANFEVVLDNIKDKKVKDVLVNNLTGGVDLATDRFNLQGKKWVSTVEAVANGSAKHTLTFAQDGVTKSQMFMGELDKRLRFKFDRSLDDVMMKGDLDVIDMEMINQVMDDTLASVYSRNVKIAANNSNASLRQMAGFVESISNLPFFGQVLPFGRFMNNVLANTWRFGFAGYTRMASDMMKRQVTTDTFEAFNRSLFAAGFFTAAVAYDKQRQKENLGTFDIRVGDSIINAENSFPLSLFLIGGRVLNSESPSPDLLEQLTNQLAVGNLATDISGLGTTLQSALYTLSSEDMSVRERFAVQAAKAGGGFFSGFTRPLDPINKVVGMLTGTDVAKDVRNIDSDNALDAFGQAGLMSLTKYVDNIAEGLDMLIDDKTPGEIRGLTGQSMRVSTREGDLRSPNALLAIFGVKEQAGRSAVETILDSVDMPRWRQNVRTRNPKYDRIANTFLARTLEPAMDALIKSERFQRLPDVDKRAEIKDTIKKARNYMRDMMSNEQYTPETVFLEHTRRRLMDKPTPNRRFALKTMRQSHDVTADLMEMSLPELQLAEYYMDIYKELRARE